DSIMATYGMLGWVFAIYRPVIAFVSGIVGGVIVNIFSKEPLNISIEQEAEAPTCSSGSCDSSSCSTEIPKKQSKLMEFYHYAFVEFLDDIAVHFAIGIIISGLISFFIPDEFFIKYSLGSGILGMLVMIAVGLPMYICATASIPIAITLMLKGVSPGAAFVFLTVGPLTNAASLAILAKIFAKKTMFIYVVSASMIAMIAGLSLDFIVNTFSLQKFVIPKMAAGHMHEGGFLHTIYIASAIVFAVMLASSLYRRLIAPKFKKKIKKVNTMNTLKIDIDGMSCNHCVNNITDTLMKQDNIIKAVVDLPTNSAEIEGKHLDKSVISELIANLGYKVVE
ncbi:MAG: permease, partial [Candidatus Delongbacteria bacterium]|nr:permease [Candidatus Delongbacteria bacterium]